MGLASLIRGGAVDLLFPTTHTHNFTAQRLILTPQPLPLLATSIRIYFYGSYKHNYVKHSCQV
jgi:hypothetical protein